MAVKPPIIPWDSTLANIVAVTGTHQTNGIALGGEIPVGGEENAWKNNTYLWFLYLLNNIATPTRTKLPNIAFATAGTWVSTLAGTIAGPSIQTAVLGTALIDLDVPQGYKLGTLTILVKGSNAAPGLTISPIKMPTTDTALTVLGTLTIAAASMITVAADQVLNMLAASTTNAGGQTVTVAAAGGTYTRSAGSFITDGFFVGQIIAWTGFVNGGNNVTKTITALSALVMTVSNTGLVNETGSANATQANGVSPTVDGTFALGLQLVSSANAGNTVAAAGLRYTCVPQ